jgi:hypothetical protein
LKAISGLAPDSPSLTDLGGSVWRINTDSLPMAFNPAVARGANGRLAIVARRTNYTLDTKFGSLNIPSGDRSVVNATYFSFLDDDLNPTEWKKLSFSKEPKLTRGAEDARLLVRDSEWFLSVVILEDHTPRARIAIYSLNKDLHATHVKTYPGEVVATPEKNWMTKLESEANDFVFVSELPDNIRGGSSLIPWGDGYLALCHKTYLKKNSYYNPMTFGIHEGIERTYSHLFVEFDSDLEIKAVSREFFLVERGIEFGTGLLGVGDDLLLSFGREDKEAWFGRVPKAVVEGLLGDKK